MTLDISDKKALIQYRIERSLGTIEEAKANLKLGFYNLVANRLYYSSYYACSALLISKGITASSHAGVNRMIHLNFVKNQIISKEDSQLLTTLFNMRQSGDYDDIFDWEREDVDYLIPKVTDFIGRIIDLISEDYK